VIVAYHHDTLLNKLNPHVFQIVKLFHQVKVYHIEDIHQSNVLIRLLNDVLMREQLSMIKHRRMELLYHQLLNVLFVRLFHPNNEH
jgi:hypothetical protein